MAEEEERRRSVDKYPGGDQGSLSSRPGFTPTREGSYQTSRYPGFVGGSTDKEGNLAFEGGSALRGIRAQRVQDQKVATAKANYDAQVEADKVETARQQETPWGPKDEQHSSYGENVDNEWDNMDYQRETDPGAQTIEQYKGGNWKSDPVYINNPGRDILQMVDQGTGGSVICTELNRQNLLSGFLCVQSSLHAELMNRCVVRGYRAWAIPYVRLMRKYRLATWLVKYIATCRCEEIAYRYDGPGEGDLIGKITRWIGEPICWVIGLFVREPDFSILYKE